jgi:hypothetical protein
MTKSVSETEERNLIEAVRMRPIGKFAKEEFIGYLQKYGGSRGAEDYCPGSLRGNLLL